MPSSLDPSLTSVDDSSAVNESNSLASLQTRVSDAESDITSVQATALSGLDIAGKDALGLVTMETPEGLLHPAALSNSIFLNARLAGGYKTGNLAYKAEKLPGVGILCGNTIVFERSNQALEGTGGPTTLGGEAVYNDEGFFGGPGTRLVAENGMTDRALISLRSDHAYIGVNLQGRWKDLNAAVQSGIPIAHPEYEFADPSQYATDHASDERVHIGIEVQATQNGGGTGFHKFNKGINACRSAIRCVDYIANGDIVNNGTDNFHWDSPTGQFNDTLLLLDNTQSVHHQITGLTYSAFNSVVCLVKRGGPVRWGDVSVANNTHDVLLILGNDTDTQGPYNFANIRADGGNALNDCFIIRVDPVTGFCGAAIEFDRIDIGAHDQALPFIKFRNYYGRCKIKGGSGFYEGCVQAIGGALFYSTLILDNVGFFEDHSPASSSFITGTGKIRVKYRDCYTVGASGVIEIGSGEYLYNNGVIS